MPIDTDHARAVVRSYLRCGSEGDREALLALFAADASFEDPVGSEPLVGHEAIGTFFDAVQAADTVEFVLDDDSIRVSGNSVAFAFTATVTFGGVGQRVSPIDVFDFGDDGLILSMRSYWNPADLITVE
jgi:steroid delta-isomerase